MAPFLLARVERSRQRHAPDRAPKTATLKIRQSNGSITITGMTGGASTFIGGDSIGIGATSTKAAQAWDFLNWTMSDEAQVEVIAKEIIPRLKR